MKERQLAISATRDPSRRKDRDDQGGRRRGAWFRNPRSGRRSRRHASAPCRGHTIVMKASGSSLPPIAPRRIGLLGRWCGRRARLRLRSLAEAGFRFAVLGGVLDALLLLRVEFRSVLFLCLGFDAKGRWNTGIGGRRGRTESAEGDDGHSDDDVIHDDSFLAQEGARVRRTPAVSNFSRLPARAWPCRSAGTRSRLGQWDSPRACGLAVESCAVSPAAAPVVPTLSLTRGGKFRFVTATCLRRPCFVTSRVGLRASDRETAPAARRIPANEQSTSRRRCLGNRRSPCLRFQVIEPWPALKCLLLGSIASILGTTPMPFASKNEEPER